MKQEAIRVSVLTAFALSCLTAADEDLKWREELHSGNQAFLAGDYQAAREHYSAARRQVESLSPDDTRRALTDGALGSLELTLGNYRQAEPLFVHAREIWTQRALQNSPASAQILADLGSVRMSQGRWKEAENLFQQAIEILSKAGPEHEIRASVTSSHLASLYASQGRIAEALPLLESALARQIQNLPASRNEALFTLSALGSAWFSLGRYEKAESYFQQAYDLTRTMPEGHLARADSEGHLGGVLLTQGKRDRAEPLLTAALRAYERQPEVDGSQIGPVLTMLARRDAADKHYALAEDKLRRVLSLFEKTYDSRHVIIGLAQVNLAQIYIDDKKFEQAQPLLESGIAIMRDTYNGMHPNLATSLFEMARLRAALHDAAQADAYFREALSGYEKTAGGADRQLGAMLRTYAQFLKSNRRKSDAKPLEARARSILAFTEN